MGRIFSLSDSALALSQGLLGGGMGGFRVYRVYRVSSIQDLQCAGVLFVVIVFCRPQGDVEAKNSKR